VGNPNLYATGGFSDILQPINHHHSVLGVPHSTSQSNIPPSPSQGNYMITSPVTNINNGRPNTTTNAMANNMTFEV
jgi:hypothetical protein